MTISLLKIPEYIYICIFFYKWKLHTVHKVEIYFKDRKYLLTGYLDTGNKLYDTYKHRPIIITSKKINYNLEDVIYVPYESLNNNSILRCLKTDKIIINKHEFNNYLVGLSNNKIKIDGINCILHSRMKGII